jgi:ADP-heptose:LPS heptosyltransferase
MGDVLMSSPAIKALKDSFGCKITLLTSSMGGKIAGYIEGIDEVIVSDVPWVKLKSNEGISGFYQLAEELRRMHFDGVVIFTVFSQNPMPAIMLAYLSGIPSRAAYCRENPYDLLTHWLPDEEPLSSINHQVVRDVALVKTLGATCKSDELYLDVPLTAYAPVKQKLETAGFESGRAWMLVHPGASERKREYPADRFKNLLAKITEQLEVNIVFSGTDSEKPLIEKLKSGLGQRAFSAAGMFSLPEFMALVDIAPVVLSVNTGTVHIAAALKTPVVVLYALTNPQHTPWKSPSKVFTFPVDKRLESKNQILKYVTKHMMEDTGYPEDEAIIRSIKSMSGNVHEWYV